MKYTYENKYVVEETKKYEENDTDTNENTGENIMMSIDNNKISFGNSHVKYLKDKNDNIWFKAKHVALLLGYKDTNKAINRVDKENRISYERLSSSSSSSSYPDYEDHQTIFINEIGLHSLVFRSKMPKAKVIERCLMDEFHPIMNKIDVEKLILNNELNICNFVDKDVFYCYRIGNSSSEYFKFGITCNLEQRENTHRREIGQIFPIYLCETSKSKQVERYIKNELKRKNMLVSMILNNKNQTEIIKYNGNHIQLCEMFDELIEYIVKGTCSKDKKKAEQEKNQFKKEHERECIELELKREETRQFEIEHETKRCEYETKRCEYETKRCEYETKRYEIELELKRLELNYKLEVMRFKHELET